MTYEKCPILSVVIVEEAIESGLKEKGYQVTEKSYTSSSGTKMKLAYSKTISDGTGAPIISTSLNTFIPCSGFDRERLILSGFEMNQIKFMLEKEEPLEKCETQSWRPKATGETRFRVAGHVSLAALQESNGVNTELAKVVPEDFLNSENPAFNIPFRKDIKLDIMTRHRYKWDIECEMKRKAFYESIKDLELYFQPLDFIKGLPDKMPGPLQIDSDDSINRGESSY